MSGIGSGGSFGDGFERPNGNAAGGFEGLALEYIIMIAIGVVILAAVIWLVVAANKKAKIRAAASGQMNLSGGSIGKRIGAFIIDCFAVIGIYLVVAVGIVLLSDKKELMMAVVNPEFGATVFTYRLLLMSFPLVAILYGTLTESSKKAATIGKKATGLRVVSANGEKAGNFYVFGRNIIKTLPILVAIMTGFTAVGEYVNYGAIIYMVITGLLILVMRKHRGIHDYAADTMVVNRDEAVAKRPVYGADAVRIQIPTPQQMQEIMKEQRVATPVEAVTPVNTVAPVGMSKPVEEAVAVKEMKIVGTGGQYERAQFDITSPVLFGREKSQCQVVFEANTPEVSRIHCEVKVENGTVYLTDKGSTYGTLVNEERMLRGNETIELREGDSFRLGKYERFIIQ